MTKTKWVLKLLSGTHAGAEMYLDRRNYRLGRSDDSDIIIRDASSPRDLLDITVEQQGVSFKCLSDDIQLCCNGVPVNGDVSLVEPYGVYSIGLFHFCFGESGENWPDLSASLYERESASYSRKNSSLRLPGAQKNQKWSVSTLYKRIANVSLVALLILVGSIANNGKLDAGIINTQQSVDITQLLEDPEYTMLEVEKTVEADQSQSLLIHGYVGTASQLAQLKRRLSTQGINVKTDIRVTEDVQRSTELLLKQFKHTGFVVTPSDEAGELTVTGVSHDLARWQKTKMRLLSDIPGLLKIKDQVQTQESRVGLLKQWIRDEHLSDDVVINAANGRLIISSEIGLNNNAAWARVKQKFKDRFGDSLELVVMNENRPKLAIRSVNYGSVPYLIMESGQKYTKGSHVYDGFHIQAIQENSVVLARGEEILNYKVGQ